MPTQRSECGQGSAPARKTDPVDAALQLLSAAGQAIKDATRRSCVQGTQH